MAGKPRIADDRWDFWLPARCCRRRGRFQGHRPPTKVEKERDKNDTPDCGGNPGCPCWLQERDHPGVTMVADKLEETLAALRAKSGKDIWLFGGASLFRSLL